MQVTFTHRAPGSGVFATNAFDSSIGKEIDVHLPDSSDAPTQARGRLVAALVSEDGSMVHLTVEIPDGIITLPPVPFTSDFSDVGLTRPGLTDQAQLPFHEATFARVRRD